MDKHYHIVTYGCQMNVHESEKMYAAFASYGVGMATDPDSADIIVMNTCCVREGAETRVIGNLGLVKKLKERKKDLIVAVCGCMTQQKDIVETIRHAASYVQLIFGTYNMHHLPEYLAQIRAVWLIFSLDYILNRFSDILAHAHDIERRLNDTCTREELLRDNGRLLAGCQAHACPYLLMEQHYPTSVLELEELLCSPHQCP